MDRNVFGFGAKLVHSFVALRKESVDRNKMSKIAGMYEVGSLSARRAWIEIMSCLLFRPVVGCRSPQGERG